MRVGAECLQAPQAETVENVVKTVLDAAMVPDN